MKRILITLVVLLLIGGAGIAGFLGGISSVYIPTPSYDTEAPDIGELGDGPNILVFSKTNEFRHIEAIPAAQTLFTRFAKEHDWGVVVTDNAAIHNPEQLAQFDLLVWNNNTGDVLTEDQRAAFKAYIENGGSVLALHGAGGSPTYEWDWYPEKFIAAQFTGHPMGPQFREATVVVEDRTHPSTEHLPERFTHYEEWYSFEKSPRPNASVLATVLEDEYNAGENNLIQTLAGMSNLAMGDDHPVIWWHKVGKGTVYFSALGHRGETYANADYQTVLEQASLWLIEQSQLNQN